jgi:hypothetical protein
LHGLQLLEHPRAALLDAEASDNDGKKRLEQKNGSVAVMRYMLFGGRAKPSKTKAPFGQTKTYLGTPTIPQEN